MSGFCNKGVECGQSPGFMLKLLGSIGTALIPGCRFCVDDKNGDQSFAVESELPDRLCTGLRSGCKIMDARLMLSSMNANATRMTSSKDFMAAHINCLSENVTTNCTPGSYCRRGKVREI